MVGLTHVVWCSDPEECEVLLPNWLCFSDDLAPSRVIVLGDHFYASQVVAAPRLARLAAVRAWLPASSTVILASAHALLVGAAIGSHALAADILLGTVPSWRGGTEHGIGGATSGARAKLELGGFTMFRNKPSVLQLLDFALAQQHVDSDDVAFRNAVRADVGATVVLALLERPLFWHGRDLIAIGAVPRSDALVEYFDYAPSAEGALLDMAAGGRLRAVGSRFAPLVGTWNRSGAVVSFSQLGLATERRARSSVVPRRFQAVGVGEGAFLLRGLDGWSWEKWQVVGSDVEVEQWSGGAAPDSIVVARRATSHHGPPVETGRCSRANLSIGEIGGALPAVVPALTFAGLPAWLHRAVTWDADPDILSAIGALQEDCGRCQAPLRFVAGNGLAAKLQLAAAEVARRWAQCQPVRLVGNFGTYSNHSLCHGRGALCLLEDPSRCPPRAPCAGSGVVRPCQLGSLIAARGLGWAFAYAQRYLFRPSRFLWPALANLASAAGVAAEPPDVAVHIRRGDKVTEAGHYHTYMPTAAYMREVAAQATRKGICLGRKRGAECRIFVASDNQAVFKEATEALAAAGFEGATVLGLRGSATQRVSGVGAQLGVLSSRGGAELAADLVAEVLFDVLALASARVLVATVASQVGRLAAGLATWHLSSPSSAKTTGDAAHAAARTIVALDHFQIDVVRCMFASYPIPVEEPWESPLTLGHRWFVNQ